jgi:hypothetical protein
MAFYPQGFGAPCYTSYYPMSQPCQTSCGVVSGPQGPTGALGPTGAKTFVIDHPKDPTRYLVHGCLEGPEAGIYYRGEATIPEDDETVIVSLPGYVDAIGYEYTVQITPIFDGRKFIEPHKVSRVRSGKFTVYGPPGDFFWLAIARRASFNVEPEKSQVEVKGQGPYKWI